MRRTLGVLAVCGFVGSVAYAVVGAQAQASQGVYTDAQAMQGEALYLDQCAVCHGDNLEGYAPNPPLSGEFFVGGWEGKALAELFEKTNFSMPATAPGTLTPEQTSSVLAFVLKRNGYPAGTTVMASTMEALGAITMDAAPAAAASAGAQAQMVASHGVYTDAQAMRGEALYLDQCAVCHGDNLEGYAPNPPLSGQFFVGGWEGKTLAELFEKTNFSMPATAPGTLTPEQTADVLSFVLKRNGYPAGTTEMASTTEALGAITVDAAPAAGGDAAAAGAAGAGPAAASRVASEGIYSEDQIARGNTVYTEQCAACHGDYLEGSGPMPALAGPDFLNNWKGRTVGELFEKTLTTMPASAPGTMTEAQTLDVLAYMLSASQFPTGATALEGNVEALTAITLDAPPAQ